MTTRRVYRNQREDEDSLNYVELTDNESETPTLEEDGSEVYVYSYKDILIEYLCSKRVVFVLVSLFLLFFGIVFWKHNYTVSLDENTLQILSTSKTLFIFSLAILSIVSIEYFIDWFTRMQLKRTRGTGAIWYYTNELSFHIPLILVLLVSYFFLLVNRFYFYISLFVSMQLYIQDLLIILITTVGMLATEKAMSKYISTKFNHNHYINRIRRCLLFDFFISLVGAMNDAEPDVVIDTGNDDGPVILIDSRGTEVLPNTLVLHTKFRAKTLENLSFGAKRVLIKEFQHLAQGMSSYSGSLPFILGKIRSLALKKANKLLKRLKRKHKIITMGDFSRYFNDPKVFDYLMKQLDLNSDEMIDFTNFVRIIEKNYREQYVILENIEQVNAAINKVTLAIQIITGFISAIIIYIAGVKKVSTIFGALSAIFGTQFIIWILPEHLFKSLIFLFVIHPYDIGDRILINLGSVEENLVVAELNVFSTLFYRWDGTSVFVPNHLLADISITNLRRSGATMEGHSIQVNAKTDPAKLEALKTQLVEFCRSKTDDYTDYVLLNYERIEDTHKLHIKILMQYQTNKQNYESYLKKKTRFMMEMNRIIKELGLSYDLPIQRITVAPNSTLKDDLRHLIEEK